MQCHAWTLFNQAGYAMLLGQALQVNYPCISNRIIAGGSSNRPEQVPESGPVIDENNNPDTAAVELPLSFEELLVPYSVTSYTCCSSGFMALAQRLSW
jgi:hypothetical protein